MDELKPCPFCGSRKLKIESKSVYAGITGLDHRVERATFSVRCNACHARGGTVGGKIIPGFRFYAVEEDLPKWATTDTKLKQQAMEAWNRRADND